MTILCNTFSPNDKAQAVLAAIDKIIKPKLIIDKVIEFDVAPIITIESTASNIVFRIF